MKTKYAMQVHPRGSCEHMGWQFIQAGPRWGNYTTDLAKARMHDTLAIAVEDVTHMIMEYPSLATGQSSGRASGDEFRVVAIQIPDLCPTCRQEKP